MKRLSCLRRRFLIGAVSLSMALCGTTMAFADAGNITEEESGYMGRSMEANEYYIEDGQPAPRAASAIIRKGIDVSYAQGNIDWTKVKAAGVQYAILRLCYGYHYGYDSQFERNAKECERLGIPYGVYVYSYTENRNETIWEAENAIKLLSGYKLSYPVYYDLEDNIVRNAFGSSSIRLSAEAKVFCDKIKAAGYQPGIYANLSWFNNYLTSPELDVYEKWVAQYYSTCQYQKPYAMWQYSSEGKVSGISGNVDMNYDYKVRTDTPVVKPDRIGGSTRYDTAISIANKLKAKLGVSKFKNIVVASGENFPDALTGCYLAGNAGAPMLMVSGSTENLVVSYIRNNLESGGKVYILGGTGAVSESFELALASIGITPKRLAGKSRYDTNLQILNNAGAEQPTELLVCAGYNFADALSSSAVNMPMMIVGDSLTANQQKHLASAKYKKIHVIGGDGAVSNGVANELKKYGTVDRISGADRYQTSTAVAKKFFTTKPSVAAITSGMNFPDGIAGGPLAMANKAPMLLVSDAYSGIASSYYKTYCNKGPLLVLGGTGVVSDSIVKKFL